MLTLYSKLIQKATRKRNIYSRGTRNRTTITEAKTKLNEKFFFLFSTKQHKETVRY